MKEKFLVLTLEEKTVVTHVRLSSEGLDLETEYAIIHTLEDSFETELEALKRVEELLESKSVKEVEIKKVFTNLQIRDDFNDYNCGHEMLLNISSKYYDLCVEYNNLADKLSKLDSDCPKFRYEL